MDKFEQVYLTDIYIQKIKNYILKKTNRSSWKEYIDHLSFGKCDLTAFLAASFDPKHIKIYQVYEHYNDNIMNILEYVQDYEGEPCGNHFINKIGDKWYDFGKGTNIVKDQHYNPFYILGDYQDMLTVELNQNQFKQLYDFVEKDYEYMADIIRYRNFLKNPTKYL